MKVFFCAVVLVALAATVHAAPASKEVLEFWRAQKEHSDSLKAFRDLNSNTAPKALSEFRSKIESHDFHTGKMTTMNALSSSCQAALNTGYTGLSNCGSSWSALWSGSATNASVAAFCEGSSSCRATANDTINSLLTSCNETDLASTVLSQGINWLKTYSSVTCLQREGEYCLPKFAAMQSANFNAPTQQSMGAMCHPCVLTLLAKMMDFSDTGDSNSEAKASTNFFFKLMCLKDGNVFCNPYLGAMPQGDDMTAMMNYICANRCFNLYGRSMVDYAVQNPSSTMAQAMAQGAEAMLVLSKCSTDKAGRLCLGVAMTELQNNQAGFSSCGSDGPDLSQCPSQCQSTVAGLMNNLGCCGVEFIDFIAFSMASEKFGNNKTAAKNALSNWIANTCATGAIQPDCSFSDVMLKMKFPNLKCSADSTNALKNDIAKALVVNKDDVTITKVCIASKGARLLSSNAQGTEANVEVKAVSKSAADSMKSEMTNCAAQNTCSFSNVNKLGAAAKINPASDTAPSTVTGSVVTTESAAAGLRPVAQMVFASAVLAISLALLSFE